MMSKGKDTAPGQQKKKSNVGPTAAFRDYERADGSHLLTNESKDPDGSIIAVQWTTDEGAEGNGQTFELFPTDDAREVRVKLHVFDDSQADAVTDKVIRVRARDKPADPDPVEEPAEPEPPVNLKPSTPTVWTSDVKPDAVKIHGSEYREEAA